MRIDWDVPIRMEDGAALRADVFRPVEEGGKHEDAVRSRDGWFRIRRALGREARVSHSSVAPAPLNHLRQLRSR